MFSACLPTRRTDEHSLSLSYFGRTCLCNTFSSCSIRSICLYVCQMCVRWCVCVCVRDIERERTGVINADKQTSPFYSGKKTNLSFSQFALFSHRCFSLCIQWKTRTAFHIHRYPHPGQTPFKHSHASRTNPSGPL